MDSSDQDLFEQGPVVCLTWQLSPGWPVVAVTHNICQFGYEAASFLSKSLLYADIIHQDDIDYVGGNIRKILADDTVYCELDYRVITKSGEVRWVYNKIVFNRDMTELPVQAKAYLLDITERKLSEQQQCHSRVQYFQFFEFNKAIELLIDPDTGQIINANRAARHFYGYDKAELSLLSINDINILSPEAIQVEMDLALTEQRDYFNFRHRLKNGDIRDVSVYSGPLLFDGRQVLHSLVYDITEQRQAEKAVIESELKFRSVIETTSEGFLILTPELRIEFTNQAFCQLSGYQLSEVTGTLVSHFIAAKSRNKLRKKLLQAHIKPHQNADLILRHKHGHNIFIRYKATTMVEGAGIFVFITDITTQKKNEIQLKKISRAVKHSASSIIITNKQGVIEYVNPRFCEVSGYSESEAIGQRPSIISTNKTPLEHHQKVWQTILNGEDWHGETYSRTKNGAFYWSMMSISPIMDDEGQICHFISVSEDITEQKCKLDKMEHLALYDPLTSLANRRLFNDRLSQAMQSINRHHQSDIGLIMLDLDYFKAINDSYGHDAGDLLLKEVAKRLLACTRKEDTVSRLGGDEFIILLQGVTIMSDILLVAQHILQSLRQPIEVGCNNFSITCSIGVCSAPEDGTEPAQLLKKVDLALYQAKNNGRNNVQCFNPERQALSIEN